jgi:hypothetical protein
VLMLAEQRGPAVTMKPWAVDRRSATLRTSIRDERLVLMRAIRPRAANEMRGKLVPNLRNVEPCNVARLTLRALLNYETLNVAMWQGSHCVI